MNWVVIASFIVCLATFSKGNALRGTSESKDAVPTKDEEPIELTKASIISEVSKTSEAQCLAGSEWTSNCHSCRCSEEGVAKCTRSESCEGRYAAPITCKPQTKFLRDCNVCMCLENGKSLCTLRLCVTADFKTPSSDKHDENKSDLVLRSSSDKKSVVCAANRMFIKDCNTCWCNEDGTSYFCTRKVCATDVADTLEEAVEQDKKRKCIPDEVFELDCNTCRCAQDGMSFSCTRRACVPEEKGKNVSLNRRIRATSQVLPKTCTPGQEFRMDCNKCLCNDEGQDFSCTRIDCTAINNNGNGGVRAKRDATTQIQLNCVPGSVFKQGCNLCHCTEDGEHATCALKRCTEKDTQEESKIPESDPSFRCNPGEQTKRDCNDCSCSADGKSVFCTLRLCDQDLSPTI